jgi:bacteriocin biosynthesis cyclodehydratase domain-containing protein
VAATIRVGRNQPEKSIIRLSAIGLGPFGERVAELLARQYPAAVTSDAAGLEGAFATAPGAVVVALWRPSPVLCEQADRLAFQNQVPWLAVTMEHPVIRIGPLVVPGAGPCFDCYRRRRIQHDTQGAATSALYAAYERDPSIGPAGYLPHHARLAAATAAQLLARTGLLPPGPDARSAEHRPPADPPVGQVVTLRLLRRGVSMSRVIGCHDCDRCGTPTGPVGDLSRYALGGRVSPTLQPDAAALLGGRLVS